MMLGIVVAQRLRIKEEGTSHVRLSQSSFNPASEHRENVQPLDSSMLWEKALPPDAGDSAEHCTLIVQRRTSKTIGRQLKLN
jgi:hypothetical protein